MHSPALKETNRGLSRKTVNLKYVFSQDMPSLMGSPSLSTPSASCVDWAQFGLQLSMFAGDSWFGSIPLLKSLFGREQRGTADSTK